MPGLIPEYIGHYAVVRELGRGGMGVVYLAEQPSMNRLVAVKVLAFPNDDFAARLRREVSALADLHHPHIVGVIDVGIDDGYPFYVMPYLSGGALSQVLDRDTRLKPGQVVTILAAMGEALQAMHQRGVVHRDIKPSNVLLSENGDPYLADFGLAVHEANDRITTGHDVLGTIGYVAPEMAQGADASPETDAYALGVLGYQLLTGRLPFEAHHIAAQLAASQAGRFEPIAEAAPDVPSELATMVEGAMALDPDSRPKDLALFASELRRTLEPKPLVPALNTSSKATQATIVRKVQSQTGGLAPNEQETGSTSFGRRSAVAVVAISSALVLLIAVAFAVQRNGAKADVSLTAMQPDGTNTADVNGSRSDGTNPGSEASDSGSSTQAGSDQTSDTGGPGGSGGPVVGASPTSGPVVVSTAGQGSIGGAPSPSSGVQPSSPVTTNAPSLVTTSTPLITTTSTSRSCDWVYQQDTERHDLMGNGWAKEEPIAISSSRPYIDLLTVNVFEKQPGQSVTIRLTNLTTDTIVGTWQAQLGLSPITVPLSAPLLAGAGNVSLLVMNNSADPISLGRRYGNYEPGRLFTNGGKGADTEDMGAAIRACSS